MPEIQTVRVQVPGIVGPAGPMGPVGPVGPIGPQGPPGGGAEGTTPADGSVTNPKLAPTAVTNDKIATDTITESRLTPTARSRFLKYESVLTLENLGCVADGTDQTAHFTAAMLAAGGRPVTGEGKTYHVAQGLVELSKVVDHRLRDTNFVLLNPSDGVAWRMLYWAPTDQTRRLHLKNVSFYTGSNMKTGDDPLVGPAFGSDTAAIWIVGGRVKLEDVEVYGYGRYSAILLVNCIQPRVIRPHIHDNLYYWLGDPTITEPYQGLRFSGCTAAYLEDPSCHNLGGMYEWMSGEVLTTRGIQYRFFGGNAYKPTVHAVQTCGTIPPTHLGGSASDGSMNWTYVGTADQAVRWYGGALAVSTSSLKVVGGLVRFCSEGIDISGGGINSDISVNGIQFEDCDAYGFKCAHSYRRVRLRDVVVKRSGIHNFIFAGSLPGESGSSDIRAIDCYSENVGSPVRLNGVVEEIWPGGHYGFGSTGQNPFAHPRSKLVRCVSIDENSPIRQGYAFRHEGADGTWELEDCYGSGFTTQERNGYKSIGYRKLGAPNGTNIFVDPLGNDNNPGFLPDADNAKQTIQAAINLAVSLDANGGGITINVAPGTYNGTLQINGNTSGVRVAGDLAISGSSGVASDVIIIPAGAASALTVTGAARAKIQNVTLQPSGVALDLFNQCYLEFGNIKFASGIRHVQCQRGARAVCIANYEIAAGGLHHLFANYGSHIEIVNKTITLTGAPAFTNSFVAISACAQLRIDSNTFVGGATGSRYIASLNGVIIVNGAGATYLPGDAAGTTSSGGQYV